MPYTYAELTNRERELAEALNRGLARTVICDAMGISSSTLRNMMTRIYLKLDIEKERDLVLIVERAKVAR